MVRTTDPTTSSGYIQPPSMPHTMPSTTAADDGLFLRAGTRPEDARCARVAQREQEQHDEDRGGVSPMHSEEHPAHQEQAGGLSRRDHEAGHRLRRDHRAAQDRCRGQAAQHSDPAGLDQADESSSTVIPRNSTRSAGAT